MYVKINVTRVGVGDKISRFYRSYHSFTVSINMYMQFVDKIKASFLLLQPIKHQKTFIRSSHLTVTVKERHKRLTLI